MLKGLFSKVVGDPNEREIQKLQPLVEAINALEPEMERRTDGQLRSMTDQFRRRLASGETLDQLLVEAFAVVREAAKRTVDMRPFDVQLIGGIVLHQGKVAEMKTGEGKTLVATMPVYLNALLGRGVHLVTVNDYLARRDTLWMGPIYHLLGLSVGLLQSGADQPAYLYDPEYQRDPYPGLRPVPRQVAYAADVTYGTNNEFGFDYLRDNLALSLEHRVQRSLYYAIVDEVDNIFIDEARTPLIISGPSSEPVEEYSRFAAIARKLEAGVHYELDEKERTVFLTDEGLAVVEQETGIENIYDEANYRYVHFMEQALKAQVLFQEGRDYIRQRKQIILIDPHTGRLMPDRRLSEGLHQAIEAKEGVPIRPRDVTSATITIQNYFRMYEKLAGMSGTAVTEAEEFFKIYKLDVVAIPTNKPMIRVDHPDVVYRSEEAKLRAVAREILSCHSRSQPVLVGTTSVEMSERLSTRLSGERLQMAALAPRVAYALQEADLERRERDELRQIMNSSLETMNSATWRRLARAVGLESNALAPENLEWIADYLRLPNEPEVRRALEQALREGIPHQVLNAKEHTREAAIIARAGEPGAVTIATNMAGRGVDIKLGGELPDEVIRKAHQVLRRRGIDPFRATAAQMDSAIAEVSPQYARRREQVLAAGGLHVLGTERHEARRIDNQLRGRSGRQGEPGFSRFYLSLEDDLMRRFGRREILSRLMEQIGDDFPIEHSLVSKTIERAQTAVEGHNFDIRKHLLEYDDVLNRQRESIYGERLRILTSHDLKTEVWRMIEGQADDLLKKYRPDPEHQRLLFASLDDLLPLIPLVPNAPFPGPLVFGGQLTAFPSFTVSFLADQLATSSSLDAVQEMLLNLPRRAAASYREQVRHTVSELVSATQEHYEERLDRFRALLDEKIEDFVQLVEERAQILDVRRLAQHLERTYPLKLTVPQETSRTDLDQLRDHWMAEVEAEFHRQTCTGLIERVQTRLPAGISLERVRVARLTQPTLAEELVRVVDLARKQARDEDARRQLDRLLQLTEPSPDRVLEFIALVKQTNALDFGRLDRLVGHVLGVYLDDLLLQYAGAIGDDQKNLSRTLERLRESVLEGKKGGRSDLLTLLRQLNGLVHVELSVLQDLLSLAVSHEYDKWAQRQLDEIEAAIHQHPLQDLTWKAVAEHLLATHYVQRQVYDQTHRRHITWMPRLPFSVMAQVYIGPMEAEELRDQILDSLRHAVELREQVWGQQEFQRWNHLSLDELDEATYRELACFVGERWLAEQGVEPEDLIEDLPPELYHRLSFVLAVHKLENQNLRLGELPHADKWLERLRDEIQEQMLKVPIGKMDDELRELLINHLRQSGFLNDPTILTVFEEKPIGDWDRRVRDDVAKLLGWQFIEDHQDRPIIELEPWAREEIVSALQRRRAFVDEERIQHFLVHQRVSDLPEGIRHTAIWLATRARLERWERRKISSLDLSTRQVVLGTLQRSGLFNEENRRDELRVRPLGHLDPGVRRGFGVFLARLYLDQRTLADLGEQVRPPVIEQLKRRPALMDRARMEGLASQQLSELPVAVASQIREILVCQLRTDLATKTMEELSAEVRHQIRQILDEGHYFVDPEKVRWYERKSLAQLPVEWLRRLERHLGELKMTELAAIPFHDLATPLQESLLALLDSEKLLTDRAARLRLSQFGTIGELPEEIRQRIALYLGRQWLTRLRDQRLSDLSENERQIVWTFLREEGAFSDEFKEELFAYQRLEEFDPQIQQVVESTLEERLITALDSQTIGSLPLNLQSEIRMQLAQVGYFLDEERQKQIHSLPLSRLPTEVQQAVEEVLGEWLLQGLDARPVEQLPADIQAALWRYLDETGYFVDEKKRAQVLDRRLTDLGAELYEAVLADLSSFLEQEISDRAVSELDEETRKDLREALERLGYFDREDLRSQILGSRLGQLQRGDLEELAYGLGRARLNAWADQRLGDLTVADQQAVLSLLQANGWLLDRNRLDKIQNLCLDELDPALRQDLLEAVFPQQMAQIRERKMTDLDKEQRRLVLSILREKGLRLSDAEMRSLHHRKLAELEPGVSAMLLQDVGDQVMASWGHLRFRDLGIEVQKLLIAYWGRRIMAQLERRVLLHTISRLWIDYLTDIEDLRRGIGLEAYGQRDPLIEYKRKAFELFEELRHSIQRDTARALFRQIPEPLHIR